MIHESGINESGVSSSVRGRTERIPHPPRQPLVGNLLQIPKSRMAQHFLDVSRQYDGIFEIDFAGFKTPFVSSAELVAELCDEQRFRKVIRPPLSLLRGVVGDALFTAHSDQQPWGKAHRILMPAFGQRAMKSYFDAMLEVAEQLSARWESRPGHDILVADDMTRLTLDTISLAGFGYRFQSFDSDQLHPFLDAMVRVLAANMAKLTKLPLFNRWRKDSPDYLNDVARMNELVDEVIRARREQPVEGNDLLNLMLTAEDPETGETLDDVNIRHQVLTFLIAGHETTSGLLTFTLYFLLRHPHVLAQAYAEVDRVLPGDTRPEYRHLGRLTVIERILKESLRLWPTAPAFMVAPYEDTLIGGRYLIRKDQGVSIALPALHRDPKVWQDPESFDIDRFLPENEAKLPPHAYKPFGNGERACIGRQFALTEAKLALALILQRFALSDPHDYRLDIKETLTLKPDNFYIRARRRQPHERLSVNPQTDQGADDTANLDAIEGQGEPFVVAWGSSLGSARDIAEEIAGRAESLGFSSQCLTLDELAGGLPQTGKLVVVTATYNGYAPDSAKKLEQRILQQAFTGRDHSALEYAVLGCGNTQWPNYQAFPRLVEQTLAETGARQMLARGEADGNGDFDGSVEAWLNGLWSSLGDQDSLNDVTRAVDLDFLDQASTRASVLPADAVTLTVIDNQELVQPLPAATDISGKAPRTSTRRLVLALPEGMSYRTGDHLAIYPANSPGLVNRVAHTLAVDVTDTLALAATGPRHLPLGKTLSVGQLLTNFLELQDPASRKDLRTLLAHTRCPHTAEQLNALLDNPDQFHASITAKHLSVADLLVRFPAISLPFAVFVALCPSLRPRFYSISSSPLANPAQVTLTAGTVQAPAWSGLGEYRGVASGYLQPLQPGEAVVGYLRTPKPAFAPPEDTRLPMILVGPGTGIAPFRGFLEERSRQAAAGQSVATSLLFHGCRHPDHDFFYREELECWEEQGIVELKAAYSGLREHPFRYVQDALWAARQEVWRTLEAGATIYVCGDGRRMAPAVRDCLLRIHQELGSSSREEASAWLAELMASGRYRQDVFNSD